MNPRGSRRLESSVGKRQFIEGCPQRPNLCSRFRRGPCYGIDRPTERDLGFGSTCRGERHGMNILISDGCTCSRCRNPIPVTSCQYRGRASRLIEQCLGCGRGGTFPDQQVVSWVVIGQGAEPFRDNRSSRRTEQTEAERGSVVPRIRDVRETETEAQRETVVEICQRNRASQRRNQLIICRCGDTQNLISRPTRKSGIRAQSRTPAGGGTRSIVWTSRAGSHRTKTRRMGGELKTIVNDRDPSRQKGRYSQ